MTAQARILLVEDNPKLATSLVKGLKETGYATRHVDKGKEARAVCDEESIDLVLLDLGLPDMDGLDVLLELRGQSKTRPVIILTARDQLDDRVEGLDQGADDYIAKPFAFTELLARIRALLRRAEHHTRDAREHAAFTLNPHGRVLIRGEQKNYLSPKEYDLLSYLMQHAGAIVSRETISRECWDTDSAKVNIDNIIDVHISRIREKLDKGFDLKLLETVRGAGFRLKSQAE